MRLNETDLLFLSLLGEIQPANLANVLNHAHTTKKWQGRDHLLATSALRYSEVLSSAGYMRMVEPGNLHQLSEAEQDDLAKVRMPTYALTVKGTRALQLAGMPLPKRWAAAARDTLERVVLHLFDRWLTFSTTPANA